jgi:DNA-binding transcriptional LysR family regulator
MMTLRELAKVDLNLLISLHVLLEERHVSKAAERLYITQPAMSKTLSRLRTLFNDDLFTRSSGGMQPTPRALALSTELEQILGSIGNLLAPATFDPALFRGEITLALSEYIGVVLLPRLVQRVNAQAPLLHLRAITRVENQLEELASGNLDFAIHIRKQRYDASFRVVDLGGAAPVILVGSGHPLCAMPVTLEALGRYPMIRLYVSDLEQMDMSGGAEALLPVLDRTMGTLEISHLLTALETLRCTSFFMPAPAYILQNSNATHGITALPAPVESQQPINYSLVAHRRTERSAVHRWLWQEINDTIDELLSSQEHKIRQRVIAGSAEPTPKVPGS